VRSVVYRFLDLEWFDAMLNRAADELRVELPDGEEVDDGEWGLALFEVDGGRRATAAAARGTTVGDGMGLSFEARDFERVREFVRGARVSRDGTPSSFDHESQAPATIRTFQAPTDAPLSAPQSAGGYDSGKMPASVVFGSRVLYVDDDPDLRDVVGAMLEAVGLEVATCSCAEEALAKSAANDFDLLVVDWNLPGMSGLDLCRTLRKGDRTSTVPVLFLSANASSRDMVEAFASGADDYVVKPFRAPELGARIFGLLRRARMAGHGPRRVPT
jgi:two-component system phosphate regulon response regulator PhoB